MEMICKLQRDVSMFILDLSRDKAFSDPLLKRAKALSKVLEQLAGQISTLSPANEPEWTEAALNACHETSQLIKQNPVSPTPDLTQEQLAIVSKVFMSAQDSVGHVPAAKLQKLLRALGDNPSSTLVYCVLSAWDKTSNEARITFNEFVQMVSHRGLSSRARQERDLFCALSVFDTTHSGLIQVSELRSVLTNKSDKLSDSEMEQLLSLVEQVDGKIKIQDLVSKLL